MSRELCAYCGDQFATDKEHVFPRNLYPLSKAYSRVQRLTIPSCRICNSGWSDDEAHFRNILTIAGEPNASRREVWETSLRSFKKLDGFRRLTDVANAMQPAEVGGRSVHKVFPGKDPRVVRVVKKVVRGLSHHHNILSAVPESRVWVDVWKYPMSDEFLSGMPYFHREPDIAEYRYTIMNDGENQSAWLITFFETVTFIGIVSATEDGSLEEPGH